MIDVELICKKTKQASYQLAGMSTEKKNAILNEIVSLLSNKDYIAALKEENKKDIKIATEAGRDETFLDRLTLTDARIELMAEGVRQIVALPDPVGEVVENRTLENGLNITRVRAPLGVVGIIYEARPNVTIDAAALCLKSGNGVVLRGSRESLNSNRALYKLMAKAIKNVGENPDVIGFIDSPDREAGGIMLHQGDSIDVVIPRGGEGLKHYVLDNAVMPVIASAGGNCHVYVEKSADLDMATKIVINAKVQRPHVCNAAEHLIVDEAIAKSYLPVIYDELKKLNVEILGDKKACEILKDIPLATDVDFDTEFLAYKITFAVVSGVKEAVDMINKYSTKHSEAIITNNREAEDYFTKYVDAAAVYVNASTRFTDGFEFGLGAEMGISTQKLHVRGPVALKELTSVKYVVYGNGQVRK